MQKIGIDEVHKRLLGLAKELDKVCTNNSIPYYMAYGTMIGAVRHHGFIPWDDDMDFVVPIEHYQRLIDCLEKDLPFPYRCRTHKNSRAVIHCFAKIEDQSTIMDDVAMDIPLEEKLGVNIDIFPLNRYDRVDKRIKKVQMQMYLLGAAFSDSKLHKGVFRKCGKHFLRLLLGGTPKYLQNSIDKTSFSLINGGKQGSIFDFADKEPVPCNWYGEGERYQFEDISLVGPKNYDGYLTHMYGDYMKLPPENQRVVHAENVYVR